MLTSELYIAGGKEIILSITLTSPRPMTNLFSSCFSRSLRTLRLTEKSDVYSFGVVLLEIITGELPILQGQGEEIIHLVKHVSQFIARGDIKEIVDSALRGEYDLNSVWKVMDMAMRCTAEAAVERPTMTEVVMQLKDSLITETTHAKSKSSYGDSSETSQISISGTTTMSIGPSS